MEYPTFRLKDRGYKFKPLGGPLDETTDDPIFRELGYAFIAWSRLEHLLTTLILHINKDAINPLLATEDPPTKFKEMLDFLKKWMTDSSLAHIRTEHDETLFKGLKELTNTRNEWHHSTLEEVDPKTGDFKMCRLTRIKKNIWQPVTTTYSRLALKTFTEQTIRATKHFVEVAKVIFHTENTGQPQISC